MTLGIGSHANIRRLLKKKVHKCCDRKVVGAVESVLVNNNFTTTVLNQFNNIDTNNTEVISNTSLDDNITHDITFKIDNITLADISSEDQTKLINDTKNYIANTLGYNINNILVYLSEGSVNINIVVFAEVEDSVFTDVDDNEYRISVLGEITESTYNGVTQNGNTLTTDNIKTAVLGKSVTSIGERAFWNSSLTEFTIPSNVTTIGDSAFAYTSGLKQFIVSSNSNHFEVIDGVLYKKNSDNTLELIQYPLAKGNTAFTFPNNVVKLLNRCFAVEKNLTSLVMPDSITSTEYYIFYDTNIESIQLSNNLENIGVGAFRNCYNLTSITIPSSVKNIGDYAFYYAIGVTEFTIPSSVTTIEDSAFAYTSGLKQFIVSSNSNHFKVIDGVLYKKNSDNTLELIQYPLAKGNTAFTFPNNVVKLLNRCFGLEKNLTSLVIPDSVTSIGEYTFYNTNIESIQLSNNLENIGREAFRDCYNLTSITIPNSVTIIEYAAFYQCNSLSSITIPSSVKTIDKYAFLNSAVSDVTFEENSQIETIDDNAFYGSQLITILIYENSITISGNTYNVGDNNISFFGANGVSIRDINTPENAIITYVNGNERKIYDEITQTTIYNIPFRYNLKSVLIRNIVTSMGYAAFFNMGNLTSVTFEDNSQMKDISGAAFNMCSNLTSVIFGDNSQLETIQYNAFKNTALTSITIPSSVTFIDYDAFNNCNNLTTVTFEENSQIETIDTSAFSSSGLTTVNIYGSSITISGNTYNAGDNNINFFGVNGVSIVQISSNSFSFSGYNFTYETTSGDNVWPHNNEKQGYDNNHAFKNSNGELEISLSKETGSLGQVVYKSSRVIMTDEKNELKLDKNYQISVEFEGKMPTAYNVDNSIDNNVPLWPAFWMMGTGIWNDSNNQPWPYCGEIDIMEWSQSLGITKYSNAIHWDENGHRYSSKSHDSNVDLRQNFHKYKTIISRSLNDNIFIKMYFDDNLVNTYQINNNNQNEFFQTIHKNNVVLSDEKYYGLIMNLALGGNYTGYSGTSIENDYPDFNNAKLIIKSIVVEKTQIT